MAASYSVPGGRTRSVGGFTVTVMVWWATEPQGEVNEVTLEGVVPTAILESIEKVTGKSCTDPDVIWDII